MKPKVLIVYASWTGNSEEMAKILAKFLKKQHCHVDLFSCLQIDAKAFLDTDICVVSTYTFGSEGNLPNEIEDFYTDLEELDLSGKVYGAMGSGEEFYGYYCKSAEDFDKQFKKTGATRGADVLKVELNPNKEDKKRIKEFGHSLLTQFNS